MTDPLGDAFRTWQYDEMQELNHRQAEGTRWTSTSRRTTSTPRDSQARSAHSWSSDPSIRRSTAQAYPALAGRSPWPWTRSPSTCRPDLRSDTLGAGWVPDEAGSR